MEHPSSYPTAADSRTCPKWSPAELQPEYLLFHQLFQSTCRHKSHKFLLTQQPPVQRHRLRFIGGRLQPSLVLRSGALSLRLLQLLVALYFEPLPIAHGPIVAQLLAQPGIVVLQRFVRNAGALLLRVLQLLLFVLTLLLGALSIGQLFLFEPFF